MNPSLTNENTNQNKNKTVFPLPATIGGYVFVDVLGKGGFSTVYKVFDQKYQQYFAANVEVIDPEEWKRGECKFEGEIRALMTLDHPNIIRLYNYFVEDCLLFIILEYCPNGSLEQYIAHLQNPIQTKLKRQSMGNYSNTFINVRHEIEGACQNCQNEVPNSHSLVLENICLSKKNTSCAGINSDLTNDGDAESGRQDSLQNSTPSIKPLNIPHNSNFMNNQNDPATNGSCSCHNYHGNLIKRNLNYPVRRHSVSTNILNMKSSRNLPRKQPLGSGNNRQEEIYQELHSIACQVLSAIHMCHSNNIAHRDIKLSNILMDENNRPKLADFGLSVTIQKSQMLDVYNGSLSYLAPEVFLKVPYDPFKSDMWSLGILLYTMVMRKSPWVNYNYRDMKKAIEAENYDPLPHRYKSFSILIRKLILFEPSKRADISEIITSDFIKEANRFPGIASTNVTISNSSQLPPLRKLDVPKICSYRAMRRSNDFTSSRLIGRDAPDTTNENQPQAGPSNMLIESELII
ncbi:hypothetical protein TRFO_05278 [Tritrichomonas foetus]|uniref:Protein kinase domain-containing protein n=1 Tax=Tritrichomonas foetus TaxID=1144522 RepID=A0A1J4K6I7_9EUKA|nr:hypothetical protein TRFO_05278 [Tritrichomonas foetus]|eukprot:OHT07081.1 hypothetical protein TRFO_05278 [Tritrichomonas foetus]